MNTQRLSEWLDKEGLEILWLVGGEKQIFTSGISATNFYGRLVFSGLYRLVDGKPSGSLWFKREEPPAKM